MSAEAAAKVQQLWEKLVIRRVSRTIAREPEDVIRMELKAVNPDDPTRLHYSGGSERVITSMRSSDVPKEDRWRLSTYWRHFYGFTTDGVYFALGRHEVIDHGLGLHAELEHDDGRADRRGIYDYRPLEGELIAGELSEGQKGPLFNRWFRCTRQFLFLVNLIRIGQPMPKQELAQKLYRPTAGWGDTYWVFANLVLNDDISPFIEVLMSEDQRPSHAAAGMKDFFGLVVTNQAIHLPFDAFQWLHEMSLWLEQPEWWKKFLEETSRLGLVHFHPVWGGVCEACEFEMMKNLDFPDYESGWFDYQFPYSESRANFLERNSNYRPV